jgi:GNAT superfamily N-acetyltransferase
VSLAIVRKVRASDKQDILEISSKIWEGHDYVPSIVGKWIRNHKCHTYGVEVDNHLVAIGNLRLTDRNQTGWMEGLRVHPDYRKRGYADMLTKNFLELGSTLKVRRLRYTTGEDNRISLQLAKKAGFRRIFKMIAVRHENLNKILTHTRTRTPLAEITPREAHDLLKTNFSMIPQNVLIYDWKAVNGTIQGFREIGKDHTFYFSEKNNKLQGLSFGHQRRDSGNPCWSFTAYALHQRELIKHFCHHLRIAFSKGAKTTVCTCPMTFENVFKEHLHVQKPAWKLQLVMLEKQMHSTT